MHVKLDQDSSFSLFRLSKDSAQVDHGGGYPMALSIFT